jgi:hypothetical protein
MRCSELNNLDCVSVQSEKIGQVIQTCHNQNMLGMCLWIGYQKWADDKQAARKPNTRFSGNEWR